MDNIAYCVTYPKIPRKDVDSLTIEQIAGSVGMGYSKFRKLFKDYTGTPPAQYRLQQKLAKAKELLTTSQMNISEIARMFGVSETGLGNFLRLHYSDILERREKERMKRGIGDNKKRGARRHSVEMYDKAVKMYNTTEKTISEVAEDCKVSLGGLSQYMRFYHKAVIRKRSAEREKAKRQNRIGHPSGNARTPV